MNGRKVLFRRIRKKIQKIRVLNIRQYIYYNYFCKNIQREKCAFLVPYKNSVISISKDSQVKLEQNFYINDYKIKGSKAECFFITRDKSFVQIKGEVHLRYGSTIQASGEGHLELGSFTCNVGINIQCQNRIEIGNDCMMGRNVVIYDSAYHPTGTNIHHMKVTTEPVVIGDHVWLGSNSVIMQGSKIGSGSVIGTAAVVSSMIEPASLVMANTNKVAMGGIIWARSMNPMDIQAAEKFVFNSSVRDDKEIDETLLQKNESQVLDLLSQTMVGVDFLKEKNLVDYGIVDSFALMSLVGRLSDKFQIEIPFTEIHAQNFNSVHQIAVMITRLMQGKKQSFSHASFAQVENQNRALLDLKEEDTEKLVVQRIMEHAVNTPEKVAIIANDCETSYRRLADLIIKIHCWLKKNSVQKGDCVVIQAIHHELCIAAYYAVHLTGGILVPVEKNATGMRILDIKNETKAICAIVSQNELGEVDWITFDALKENIDGINTEKLKLEYPSLDDPCEMIFTTGTTGKSKGVLMTHRHISWYAYSVAKAIEMKQGNRFFITTPLNHAGGLRRTHLSLANGCTVVYLDGLSNLGKYFEYIEKYKVTSLYLPPVAIRILLTRAKEMLSKFSSQIDFVYSSSSPMPIGDCEEMKQILPNTRLYNAYEASETPGVCAYNYNIKKIKRDCLGQANVGVQIGVLTDSGELMTGQTCEGQICVKSKMNMKEYYMEPELTASVWKDGWFVSSDLGGLDAEGNLYYKGRKGDVINIGGYKIAPTEIEEVALLSGLVQECICIESVDEYGVQYLKLLVVKKDMEDFDIQAINQYIAKKLEAYKVPRVIEVVDEIKKTFNGKINRKAYKTNNKP